MNIKKYILIISITSTLVASEAITSPLSSNDIIQTHLSPKVSVERPGAAWRLANEHAERTPGSEVVLGLGDSMEPVYRNRTVLVIEKQNFADLQAGMTVVFIGKRGHPVAHVLVKRVGNDWEACGVNNGPGEMDRITKKNFRGRVALAIELKNDKKS